jgi:hypothetical protein
MPERGAEQMDELGLAVGGQPVRRAAVAPAVALLGHEAVARQRAQRVVDGAGIEVRPVVGAPGHQLTAHEIAVHGLEDPHGAEDQQARRRHVPSAGAPR